MPIDPTMDEFLPQWARPERPRRRAKIQVNRTGWDDTPAPADLGPASICDPATGQLVLAESPESMVRKAAGHIQNMAFLPVDPRAEEIVDALVERKLRGATMRPLQRKI